MAAKRGQFVCPECGKTFTKLLSALNNNINKGRRAAGPYCSPSCAGKEGSRIKRQKRERGG
jgi:DNA-directed RNA polymerase subunit RPC12/RpoP